MNRNYQRSRQKEYQVKHELESKGYYAIRASGSHGVGDIIGIKPTKCGNASHFEVRFIQIKVSENLKKPNINIVVVDTPCGMVNVELTKFPVKSKKYYEHYSRSKRRTAKKRIKSKLQTKTRR